MRHVCLTGWIMIVALTPLGASWAVEAPPVAPVRNVVTEYWGVEVDDPYRYMEDLDDPEVQAWIQGQAESAAAVLKRIPGRDDLLARIRELDAGSPYRIFGIRRMTDGTLFYLRQGADENLARLYERRGFEGPEHLLIDPSTLTPPDGGFYSLLFYRPSPDGQYVIYGLAPSGSEKVTLRVLDVAGGRTLPDSIDRIEPYYTPPQWLPDGRGFFYCRLREPPAGAPPTEGYKRSRTFLHRLGDDIADDRVALAMNQYPGVSMTAEDFPSIVVPPGSDYAIGKIKHGDANPLTLFSAPLSAVASPDTPWKMICDTPDSVTDFAVFGDRIYLLTSRDAPRFRLVSTSLANPDFDGAETVIAAGTVVLESLAPARDALYVGTLRAGMNRILRVDYPTGQVAALDLPEDAPSGYIVSASPEVDGILVQTVSWTRRGGTCAYDPRSGTFTDTGLNPKGRFDDVPGFESVEVEVPGHDGVMVPLSIIYQTGISLDGSHPTLLGGYGAYGLSLNVHPDPRRLAWLERGGVMAIAHVRGGGEKGEEWHLAGQKLTKPNTWKDFIACASYLIDHGYASRSTLAGQGGSAGGILIGRAITERPDLFAAALINVGALDAIRMETTTNGVPNIQEFGTVAREDEFRGLLAMSSYHHVRDGVRYPAVLLAHGINDPRVAPWMSAKMCARLQAATASGKPILFRVDYHAGHGIGSTKSQHLELLADEWAFLLWQLGVPGFQP